MGEMLTEEVKIVRRRMWCGTRMESQRTRDWSSRRESGVAGLDRVGMWFNAANKSQHY